MIKRLTAKQIILIAAVVVVAAALVCLPFLLNGDDGQKYVSSALTYKAEKGDLDVVLNTSGSIEDPEAQEVQLPSGIVIKEYLVKNGQVVEEGAELATVDRSSVMEAISSVNKTMELISDSMQDEENNASTATLQAISTGRVKAVYGEAGDSVSEVMLEHGSLAVLSLDGYMAAALPSGTELADGDSVSVTLSGGAEVAGLVSVSRDGSAEVLIDDQYGSIGETVSVKTADGKAVAEGSLYVHSAWDVIATSGKISSVNCSEGSTVRQSATLFRLSSMTSDGSYEKLASQRREYEEIMSKLFRIYQDGVVKAESSGMISGVDTSVLTSSETENTSYDKISAVYASNAPGQDSEASFYNRVGMITALGENGTATIYVQNWDTEIPDYQDTSYVITDPGTMTESYNITLPTAYMWNGTEWVSPHSISAGDVFIFAYAEDIVWMIYVGHNDIDPAEWPAVEVQPQQGGQDQTGQQPGEQDQQGQTQTGQLPAGPDQQTQDGEDKSGTQQSGSGQYPSFDGGSLPNGISGGSYIPSVPSGSSGYSGQGGSQNTVSYYSTEQTTIMSITPLDKVTVTVSIDELDRLAVNVGQEAVVTLDALPGRTFSGIVESIEASGSNSGGNSKYSAVISLDRTDSMLAGMNTSVSIVLSSEKDAILIPSEALGDDNGQTVIYKGYDERSGSYTGKTAVKTGKSDGIRVEILSGLEEGEIIWYPYYE